MTTIEVKFIDDKRLELVAGSDTGIYTKDLVVSGSSSSMAWKAAVDTFEDLPPEDMVGTYRMVKSSSETYIKTLEGWAKIAGSEYEIEDVDEEEDQEESANWFMGELEKL